MFKQRKHQCTYKHCIEQYFDMKRSCKRVVNTPSNQNLFITLASELISSSHHSRICQRRGKGQNNVV